MILTTHALVGAAIGKHISNPLLIPLIALPLHYFLDSFRHGEYLGQESATKEVLGKVAIDIAMGLFIITIYAYFFHPSIAVMYSIFLGAFISMFPDFITFLHWKLHVPYLGKIYKFHQWVHRYQRGSKERTWNLRNASNDILFSIISIALLIL